jgi:hypothetical protein
MDRAVYAAPAGQLGVSRVDNDVNRNARDVALMQLQNALCEGQLIRHAALLVR